MSAVLRDRKGSIRISEATRRKVLEAAEALAYVPNVAAQRLARGRSGLIGILCSERVLPLAATTVFHDILVGVEDEILNAGLGVLLAEAGASAAAAASGTITMADGVLIIGPYDDKDRLGSLVASGRPTVSIGRRGDATAAHIRQVSADYVTATRALMARLVELGHDAIMFIQTHDEPPGDRLEGFQRAVAELGVHRSSVLQLSDPRDPQVTQKVMAAIAERSVTAVVIQGDDLAPQLCEALAAAGLIVGEDVSVVDLQGTSPALGDDLVLAHLRVPRDELGRAAVRKLLKVIAGDDNEGDDLIPCEVDFGNSVAAPPGR